VEVKKASCSIVIPTLGRDLELIQNSIEIIAESRDQQQISVSIKVVLNDQRNQELETLISKLSSELNIELLTMGKNLGFAAATNAGIIASNADYIVTLNDDAWMEPEFLTEMIKTQRETGADMVASTIYRGDTKEIDSCGVDFAWRGKAVAMKQVQANNNLILTSTLDDDSDNWRQNLDLLPEIDNKQKQAIIDNQLPFGPDAAAALYTRKMLDQIGLFNESYFAYLEDVDLALRARLAGFSCAWASKAIVHHEKHTTSAKMGKFKQKKDVKNWWRMVTGSYPKEAWSRFGGQILLERARNIKGLLV